MREGEGEGGGGGGGGRGRRSERRYNELAAEPKIH